MAQHKPERDPVVQAIIQTYTTTHLHDEDLLDYIVSNAPETMEHTRAQHHLARCLICQQRLAFLQEVSADVAAMSAVEVPQEYYAMARRLLADSARTVAQVAETGVSEQAETVRTPEPREPLRQTLGARLAAARKRLQEVLMPLSLPAGFGQPLVPQYYAHHASQHAAIDGEVAPGLWVLVEPLDSGGQKITVTSEQANYAGQLIVLQYTVQQTAEELLKVFCALPAMPDEAYEAVVYIPSETTASWTDVQLEVYPIEPADLDEDAVPTLSWSIRHAADPASQEAWQSLCQRLQQDDQGHAVVRAWHAAQLDVPERHT